MKTRLSKNKVIHQIEAEALLKPDIVVLSGIKELDALLGGFKAGEITFIDGDSRHISNISNMLCVNTYRTFHSSTIYIDGGMCTNPYKIAEYARKMELDQKHILKNVHLSRAFTVHQLTTLVQKMLEPAIKRYQPQTLIIGRLPVLFLDSDIKSDEAQTLLKENLREIKEITKKHNIITVFTNHDKEMISTRRNTRKIIRQNADEIVIMKQREQSTFVQLIKKQKNTIILDIMNGQMRLQDFGMVIEKHG